MTLFAQSSGVLARQKMLSACFQQPLKKYTPHDSFDNSDAFIAWGMKPNSLRYKKETQKYQCPFFHLEDGFIGYVGHPAKGGHAVSVVKDKLGIYYDARQPSDLDDLIIKGCDDVERQRANDLIHKIKAYGITKYNAYPEQDSHCHLPLRLNAELGDQTFVLVVDQVAGDQSVSGAMADESVFLKMVKSAKTQYPDSVLVIRTHPDTLWGKKKGVLANYRQHSALQNVLWFDQPCHPHALIHAAKAVFTVSSQMGFEALLYNKPVYCFGMPFYAGWGLTNDQFIHPRRHNRHITLAQLCHAALIAYPHYYDPISEQRCEVEDIIAVIQQQIVSYRYYHTVYLVGFSFWKRAFMVPFCRHLAQHIKFVNQPPKSLLNNEKIVVWGNKYPDLINVIRIEDGFIRSSGLGSNLSRPSSLVIDDVGIYFNAERNNRLRALLNEKMLTQSELVRSKALIKNVIEQGINKYNLASVHTYSPLSTDKKKLLVVGQVDGDASIVTGSPIVTSNQALLFSVRQANPDAYIIYKPHPDVVAGNRDGLISGDCYQQCVDEEITQCGLEQLYPHIDALHTMTSLSGFEALMRGVSVVTWGQPFYAGWGLTLDMNPASDRKRTLSLEALCYITLVCYPMYIDWDSGLHATPEQLINKMSAEKTDVELQQSRWQRWRLKFGYLMETLQV